MLPEPESVVKVMVIILQLMELNRERIKDADMIGIGWELKVPEK